jgi:hypothetical protein
VPRRVGPGNATAGSCRAIGPETRRWWRGAGARRVWARACVLVRAVVGGI